MIMRTQTLYCDIAPQYKPLHVVSFQKDCIYIWEIAPQTILHEWFCLREVLNMWRLSGANLQHSVDEYGKPR